MKLPGVFARLPPEMQEFAVLCAKVMDGEPREWIEKYLKVVNSKGQLVPLLFSNEPNQEYYYQELREQLRRWLVDVVTEKDRKARWTTFVAAVLWAKMCCIPGTRVLWVADSEDTTGVGSLIIDTFWANMPEHARPAKGKVWGAEAKELVFAHGGTEQKSWILFRTANNKNLGTGETPTDVVFDEYPKFPNTFGAEAQASVLASMTGDTSFWKGGTVGPDGADCEMYREIQSIRAGESQTKILFRPWYLNPANHLPPRHKDRRPQDYEDEGIVAGDPEAGLDADQEEALVALFPQDGIPWQWRLARHRAWARDALRIAGGQGNEDAARIYLAREHPKDDMTMWLTAGRMQFDFKMMETQRAIASARENFVVTQETIHGLLFKAWRKHDPAHVYILGLDLGSGTKGDDTSGQLLDATAMVFMGEVHGNVTEPYHAVAAAIKVLQQYGSGILVVETNRFPGIGNHAFRTLGYRNTWKPPMRDGEKIDAYIQRPYGMHVGAAHHSEKEPSAEELLGQFKQRFNTGAFKVVNPHLLETMQRWNPDVERHCPDRIAGARLAPLALDAARRLQPVTGVSGQHLPLRARLPQSVVPSGPVYGVPSRFH